MKYELTREQLEEMVQCIVINHFDVDEAMEYALSICGAFTCEDAEVVWPESDERINAIAVNGNDGLHYDKVTNTGVYEAWTDTHITR